MTTHVPLVNLNNPPSSPTIGFMINNKNVRSTFVFDESLLSSHLSDFLSTISIQHHRKRVVGVDIQTVYSASPQTSRLTGKVAILNLFSGGSGLNIHLIGFTHIPSSLATFLDLPHLLFTGVGITRDIAALHRDYGLQCRNVVELGKLAATVLYKPHMSFLGLAELARDAGMEYTLKAPNLPFLPETLTAEQVMSVTMPALLSFLIANLVLGGCNSRFLETSDLRFL